MILTFDNLLVRQGSFTLSAQFSITRGGRIALLGPSGGGKSTLLAALAGFQELERGRIHYDGTDISDLPPAERPFSLLFQDHNLFPHLSAEQNVGLGLRPNLRLSGAEWDRVRGALARVGLEGQGGRRPAQLSGGQQQRVALARVLLRDKPVLLLDEPFAALGPALRHDMLQLVMQIAGDTGATLLMVTHQPDEALWLSDQTILVADGMAHAPQDTRALLDNPPPALATYLGDWEGA